MEEDYRSEIECHTEGQEGMDREGNVQMAAGCTEWGNKNSVNSPAGKHKLLPREVKETLYSSQGQHYYLAEDYCCEIECYAEGQEGEGSEGMFQVTVARTEWGNKNSVDNPAVKRKLLPHDGHDDWGNKPVEADNCLDRKSDDYDCGILSVILSKLHSMCLPPCCMGNFGNAHGKASPEEGADIGY